jgi:hypothetical protein
MSALESELADVLDRLAPARDLAGDWTRVLRDADAAEARLHRRRSPYIARLALAAAVLVIAATVAVAWPFQSEKLSVLDRALAAVGDGPVVRLVLQDEWGGKLVDLETGERRELRGTREIWFDPKRGLHEVGRFGGTLQSDVLYPAGKLPPFLERTVAGIASGYREALESGQARILGEDVVDGVGVYWIRVHAEMLPDVADGKLHEWAHDVAVSKESYEPVYLRETRDGKPGPQTGARILEMTTLPDGDGDFSVDQARPQSIMRVAFGRALTSAEARGVLEGALWAGDSVSDLPLVGITELQLGVAQAKETRVGRIAGSRVTLPPTQSEVRRRGNDVFRVTARGPWQETRGVVVFYGYRPADPRQLPFGYSEPHVLIQQAPGPNAALQGGVPGYRPPEGKVLLVSGSATLSVDGVYVVIRASSDELALAAARALRPMPAS